MRRLAFGDRGAWVRLGVLVGLLVPLHHGTQGRVGQGRVNLFGAAAHPVYNDGREFRHSGARVVCVGPDGIVVEDARRRVRVEAPPGALRVGERVAVEGRWDQAGVVRTARVVPLGARPWLRAGVALLSLAALAVLAAGLARYYRLRPPPQVEPRSCPTR